MRILSHTDNDGKCAAAIVGTFFIPGDYTKKFYTYNYSGNDILSEEELKSINPNERFYITDLSFDGDKNDPLMMLIKKLVDKYGIHVYHIDHHASTESHMDEMKSMLDNKELYTAFISTKDSASLLTWIVSNIHTENHHMIDDIIYETEFDRSGYILNGDTTNMYHIPMVVRYVDDNDVWRHQFPESKAFTMGTTLIDDSSPENKGLWETLLMGEDRHYLAAIIKDGDTILKYTTKTNANRLKMCGFSCMIEGHSFLCLNEGLGNSSMFGEHFDEYDAVIKFSYVGKEWKYTGYVSDKRDPDGKFDISKMAEFFGGGGHKHAAGWSTKGNMFNRNKAGMEYRVTSIKKFN